LLSTLYLLLPLLPPLFFFFFFLAGTLYVYYKEMEHDGTVSKRDTTMTFTTFVMFDMFNAMACRHSEKPVVAISPFSNTSFLLAIGGSLIGQLLVVYFPPLQVREESGDGRSRGGSRNRAYG